MRLRGPFSAADVVRALAVVGQRINIVCCYMRRPRPDDNPIAMVSLKYATSRLTFLAALSHLSMQTASQLSPVLVNLSGEILL